MAAGIDKQIEFLNGNNLRLGEDVSLSLKEIVKSYLYGEEEHLRLLFGPRSKGWTAKYNAVERLISHLQGPALLTAVEWKTVATNVLAFAMMHRSEGDKGDPMSMYNLKRNYTVITAEQMFSLHGLLSTLAGLDLSASTTAFAAAAVTGGAAAAAAAAPAPAAGGAGR